MRFKLAAIALLTTDATGSLLRGATDSVVHRSLISDFNETDKGSTDEHEADIDLSAQSATDLCHAVGAYKTGFSSEFTWSGGGMVCSFPVDTDSEFPLLSFAHGYGGGGLAIYGYTRMLHAIASSGFVVCAYTDCWPWCPKEWPKHQLNVLTKAKEGIDIPDIPDVDIDIPDIPGIPGIPDTDDIPEIDIEEVIDEIPEVELSALPIRKNGDVGIIGHSAGGISTLLAAYKDVVLENSIGSAVLYDGDGASYANQNYAGVSLSLEEIDSLLPLFLPASTTPETFGAIPQCKDHTIPNAQHLLKSDQPLIAACINQMDHLDNFDTFFRQAPLIAVPYIVAFFGYTLDPSEVCTDSYEEILGAQLRTNSPQHYINNLFDM